MVVVAGSNGRGGGHDDPCVSGHHINTGVGSRQRLRRADCPGCGPRRGLHGSGTVLHAGHTNISDYRLIIMKKRNKA